MTKRKRREYTKEFKADAVRLVKKGGKSAFQVARDLDLSPSALRYWIKQAEIDLCKGTEGALSTAEREELKRLRKENKVEKARQIHKTSNRGYGSARVYRQMKAEGIEVGRNRVARLMRENGIHVHPKRGFLARLIRTITFRSRIIS